MNTPLPSNADTFPPSNAAESPRAKKSSGWRVFGLAMCGVGLTCVLAIITAHGGLGASASSASSPRPAWSPKDLEPSATAAIPQPPDYSRAIPLDPRHLESDSASYLGQNVKFLAHVNGVEQVETGDSYTWAQLLAQLPNTNGVITSDMVGIVKPVDHSILRMNCYVVYGVVAQPTDTVLKVSGVHQQSPTINIYKTLNATLGTYGECIAPPGSMSAPVSTPPPTAAPASAPAAGPSSSSKPASAAALTTAPVNTTQPVQSVVAQPTEAPKPAPTTATNAAAAPGAIKPASYTAPSHYASNGTPEYGQYGSGNWQVAAIVNAGEPSFRVVYDQSVPGAYHTAMATVTELQADFSTLPQPGVTTGLKEVGYSAHYDGVQVQVYADSSTLTGAAATSLERAGISLIPMQTA